MNTSRWTRGIGADRQRRLAVGVAAWLVGFMGVLWWAQEDLEAWQVLQDEITQLQARLPEAGSAPPRATTLPPDSRVSALPDPAEDEAVWAWLQQGVQAQGLRLLALKPQPVMHKGGLPEQPVLLHLQGRWSDWLAFVQALGAHAPWCLVDQWLVVPANPARGDVRIELQARLGLRPPALGRPPVPRVWPVWPVASANPPPGEALVFAQAGEGPVAAAVAPEGAAANALPADPRQWPVQELRLLGVWHQAGVSHAVLGAGLHQVVLAPGQRVGREAYRVRRVGDAEVELAALATGPALHLTLKGDKR